MRVGEGGNEAKAEPRLGGHRVGGLAFCLSFLKIPRDGTLPVVLNYISAVYFQPSKLHHISLSSQFSSVKPVQTTVELLHLRFS